MPTLDVPEGVDGDALAAYLAAELGTADRLTAHPLGGGNANETLAVTWGDRELVLRRPPAVEPIPDLLHDVVREYAVLTALVDEPIPTPTPVCCCRDESVLGGPFYAMDRVAGDIPGGTEPERFGTPDHRRRAGEVTVDALATLHGIDPTTLAPPVAQGRADLEAAVASHTERLERALDRTAERRELPRARAVGDWLAENVPAAEETVLVHGDYKPDNVMFAPGTPPRVAAVLDWEMAGAGDPLTDLGWLLANWGQADDPDPVDAQFLERFGDHDLFPVLESYLTDHAGFMTEPGYPSRRALVSRYEDRTGLTYHDDRFYRTLAMYKLASICESFFALAVEAPDRAKSTYPLMAVLVPLIAARAELIVAGEHPL